MRGLRRPGISTLVSCQNEEPVIALCLLSFLPISDEIIVVDNGSKDATPELCRALAGRYPDKIRFFEAPHLSDLYQSRQYALRRSRYQWIVRADADYVCYTDGPYDGRHLREHLLSVRTPPLPLVFYLMQPSVTGDFRHTADTAALPEAARRIGGSGLSHRSAWTVSPPMPRVYRHFPGFAFVRLGRMEGARFNRRLRRIYWPSPIWMHCDVKSDENYFRRSERTNWRERGDTKRFPTLDAYLREIAPRKYGTRDLKEAESIYVKTCCLPSLVPYDERQAYPYPRILRRVMDEFPVYRVHETPGGRTREYLGPAPLSALL